MENDTEEVFYPNVIGLIGFIFIVVFILIFLPLWSSSVAKNSPLQGFIWIIWIIGFGASLGCIFYIIFNFKKFIAKLVISASGIKYSDCLGRIDCTWEDVKSITMVNVNCFYVSGEFCNSWIDCHIFSAQGNISLTTDADDICDIWGKTTLNNIFKKIIFIKPSIRITESSTTKYYYQIPQFCEDK